MLLLLLAPVSALLSCDDDTAEIGSSVMPSQDNVITSQLTFNVASRTIQSDSVLANTNDSYLGCVIDPETKARTTCNFLAQFNVLEGATFPTRSRMLTDDNGELLIDSACVRIFINSYYGDSLTTMKLTAQELDTAKVISEDVNYYTNLDPEQFLTEGKGVKTTMSYAVRDLSRSDSAVSNSAYKSIIVYLPTSYGRFLAEKYYENPTFYSNSYWFNHHVCPGFYFKTTGGLGSMVCAETSTLDVYFRYHSTTSAGNDTIMAGMQRMAATEEVIQQTSVENKIPASMLDTTNAYTYIKSPAGLFTELTLPVSDVVAGEHYNDTINSASLTLQRHNNNQESDYNLEAPEHIVLLRKANVYSFFEKNQLTNSTDSYMTSFEKTYNAYTFSNISKLLTLLRNERHEGAGILSTDTEAQRAAKFAAWEAEHPDWNKVVLVPVAAEYSTSTNTYGISSSTLVNIKNELGMKSVRLKGGSEAGITMSVIYSRFKY